MSFTPDLDRPARRTRRSLLSRTALYNRDTGGEDKQGDARSVSSAPPRRLGIGLPSTNHIVPDPVPAGAGREEFWRERRQNQP